MTIRDSYGHLHACEMINLGCKTTKFLEKFFLQNGLDQKVPAFILQYCSIVGRGDLIHQIKKKKKELWGLLSLKEAMMGYCLRLYIIE